MNDESGMEQEVIRRVELGLSSGDTGMVEDATNQMTVLAIEMGSFSESFFGSLLELIGSSDFAKSQAAKHVLYACMANWEVLGRTQQRMLLGAIERAYPGLSDDVACFVAAELVGTHCCDEDGLALLMRVREHSAPRQRAGLPHGLELLAKECIDRVVALKAYNELVAMRGDSSEIVRQEVDTSLKRLAVAYPPYPRPVSE